MLSRQGGGGTAILCTYVPHIDHTRATPFNAILTMKTTFGSESNERRILEVKSTMARGRRQYPRVQTHWKKELEERE